MIIQIGRINKFRFENELVKESLSPHPEEGRIYRIIKTGKGAQLFYQLYIGALNNKAKMDCIYLGPILKGEYEDKWEFDIDLITKKNYLEYNYTPEDLVTLKEWLDSDHADLRAIIEKKTPVKVNAEERAKNMLQALSESEVAVAAPTDTINKALNKIQAVENEIEHTLTDFQNSVNSLLETDIPLMLSLSESISFISKYMVDNTQTEKNNNMTKQYVLNSKTHDASIFSILNHLQGYKLGMDVTQEHKLSLGEVNKAPLYMTIYYCLLELQRIKLQTTND